jgi:RES domain
VPKEELITSATRDYVNTAKWAQALHHQFKDVDGLIWMSKQRDRDRALLLFGDRLRGVLSGTRVGGPLGRNDELHQAILAAALRAGIDAGRRLEIRSELRHSLPGRFTFRFAEDCRPSSGSGPG